MQGLSSWLWGFNLLLLRLHWEISPSLLCSHNFWGSALVVALPLHVGRPQASFSLPDRRGLKQQLIRALLLTEAGEREGYGSYNWNGWWAWGGRGWRDIATAWGVPCVLPGKLSLDRGTLAVACCTVSLGVCVVTSFAHRILGGSGSSVSGSCLSLWSELIVAAHTRLWSLFRWCSAFCGHSGKESPLLAYPETKVSWLLGNSKLFPGLPPG